ncbi:hypothetical protein G9A89_014121 [Geosiphon pyriformis]|nr:hypothetical protein G9A89_014121 [Geosiphon pyriformis]
MAMYTDVKVDGQFIKLILDSKSAGSIITKQLMDQLGRQKGLDDQKGKENKTTNLVLLVEKLSWMKECGMTFQGEEKHATNHANT